MPITPKYHGNASRGPFDEQPVRRLLRDAGIHQHQVARIVGVSSGAVGSYLRGYRGGTARQLVLAEQILEAAGILLGRDLAWDECWTFPEDSVARERERYAATPPKKAADR